MSTDPTQVPPDTSAPQPTEGNPSPSTSVAPAAPAQGAPAAPDPSAPAAPVQAEKNPNPGLDIGQAEVQARMDAVTEKGYIGGTPDPTPNEHYSLETGPDAPTPETDPELQAQADAAVRGNRLMNTGVSTAQTEETFRTP